MLRELSQTIPLLESIDLDSYLTWTFHIHTTIILLSQEDTFSMNVKDLMGIGTREEIH